MPLCEGLRFSPAAEPASAGNYFRLNNEKFERCSEYVEGLKRSFLPITRLQQWD